MNFEEFIQNCLTSQEYHKIPNICWSLQSQQGGGFAAYWDFVSQLAERKDWHLIQDIHAASPENNPLRGTTHYFMAGLAAQNNDIELCRDEMKSAMVLFQNHLQALATDERAVHSIRSVMKQFALITPDIDLEDVPPTQIKIETEGGEGTFFVLSSCNGIYFERFGERFVRSVLTASPDTICHIHLINSTAGSNKLQDKLSRELANVRFTVESGPQEATFYACRRLQVVGALMNHYDKAALVSDIDAELTSEISVFSGLSDTPAALFKRQVLDPMLIMHLSLSYYGRHEATIQFLDYLDRYLSRHLSQGFVWTLDQCALIVSALKAQAAGNGFEMVDLNEKL